MTFPGLMPILLHPSVRGMVSGIGVLDILLAFGMFNPRSRRPPVSLPHPTRKSPSYLLRDGSSRVFRFHGAVDEQCEGLIAKIAEAAMAGVDWIQIREKDFDGAD